MSLAELQTYRDQLAFVNLSLESDPENADFLSLKSELLEIISLTEQAMGASSSSQPKPKASHPTPEASKNKGKSKETAAEPTPTTTVDESGAITGTGSGGGGGNWQDRGLYKAGMDCMAKYKDNKYYPARISAVTGSQDSPLFTITFKGYSSSTNVPLSSLKPHDPSAPIPQPQKRQHEELSEKEKEKKKKKGDKWMASQTARTEEVKGKKAAWEKFGKKAAKKGIQINGLQGKSQFSTPESATGKVGVVGSGKGLTDYTKMGKHKFERGAE